MSANNLVISSLKDKRNAENTNIKPDENGYMEFNLGRFNTFNLQGQFYKFDPVKKLFQDPNSSLQRRLHNGFLKGENGHPVLASGMSKEDYFRRLLEIREDNICCHIKELRTVDLGMQEIGCPNGQNIIQVKGKIKPDGPLGGMLEARLKDPDMNVAFSIRTLTRDYMYAGIHYKDVVSFITYDHVIEPGIYTSNKWSTAGLESIALTSLDLDNNESLQEIVTTLEKSDLGLESKTLIDELRLNTNIVCTSTKDLLKGW
jgi:hypothetical protein